jgi:hypothetical protein
VSAAFSWVEAVQWMFFAYFIGLNAGYLSLMMLSAFSLRRYMQARSLENLFAPFSGFEPPVSILVPPTMRRPPSRPRCARFCN